MVDIHKNTLSQINLFHGEVNMPKGFEIDREKIQQHIITHLIQDCEYPFSKEWDKLTTYLREHINLYYNFTIIPKLTTGYVFKENEHSPLELDVDRLNLRESPDYTMLYGVNVNNCSVKIYYDDNRRVDRSWDITLENNKFIMFPTSQYYAINNNQTKKLNVILKSTYEYI